MRKKTLKIVENEWFTYKNRNDSFSMEENITL